MENLKCDLQEILNLTRETLNEMKGTSNSCEDLNEEDDPYAQEMAIFLAEINECKSSVMQTNDNAKDHANGEMEKFKVIHFDQGQNCIMKSIDFSGVILERNGINYWEKMFSTVHICMGRTKLSQCISMWFGI